MQLYWFVGTGGPPAEEAQDSIWPGNNGHEPAVFTAAVQVLLSGARQYQITFVPLVTLLIESEVRSPCGTHWALAEPTVTGESTAGVCAKAGRSRAVSSSSKVSSFTNLLPPKKA